MAAILVVHLTDRTEDDSNSLEVARKLIGMARGHGAEGTLRVVTVGGESEQGHIVRLQFENAVARAAFLDDPEFLTAGPGKRTFLDELPAVTPIRPEPRAILDITFHPAAGREAEVNDALVEAIGVRGALGIEVRIFVAQYAAARTGLRHLEISGSSHRELTEDMARVIANRERVGGIGPIPKAIVEGAMSMGNMTMSIKVDI